MRNQSKIAMQPYLLSDVQKFEEPTSNYFKEVRTKITGAVLNDSAYSSSIKKKIHHTVRSARNTGI